VHVDAIAFGVGGILLHAAAADDVVVHQNGTCVQLDEDAWALLPITMFRVTRDPVLRLSIQIPRLSLYRTRLPSITPSVRTWNLMPASSALISRSALLRSMTLPRTLVPLCTNPAMPQIPLSLTML